MGNQQRSFYREKTIEERSTTIPVTRITIQAYGIENRKHPNSILERMKI